MAKANQPKADKAAQPKADKAATAPVFPTAQEIHAVTEAVLNAPPKGINWEGFETELTKAFAAQHEAEESLRTLAGKMYQCGVRFAHFNNDKGEMDDKQPVCIELRKRLTKRLSTREQVLVGMDRWNAAALDTVEKAIRKLATDRLNTMMSLMRKHLKSEENIKTGRGALTLEQKLYAMCTLIREEIVKADPDKVKFDIGATRELIEELREHFNI
jgi:hypothetical protein